MLDSEPEQNNQTIPSFVQPRKSARVAWPVLEVTAEMPSDSRIGTDPIGELGTMAEADASPMDNCLATGTSVRCRVQADDMEFW